MNSFSSPADTVLPSRPFRVAITGGGIGGLFCTLAPQHHCAATGATVHIDVYEQANEIREIGAGVGLGVNAVRMADRLGFSQAIAAIPGNRGGVWMAFRRYDTSEAVSIIREPAAAEPGVYQMPCARSELLDLLRREALRRSGPSAVTTLHTGKACVGVVEEQRQQQPARIAVRFRDDTTAVANMVVGCDGIHSAVDDRPAHSGLIAYRGVVPTAALPAGSPFLGDGDNGDGYSHAWVAKHRHFLAYPIARNERLNIVAFITKADRPEETVAVRESFLLGDAAHAMLPHLGAGTGQSFEDGWVLAHALADHLAGGASRFATLEVAMQLYHDVRLPRAQRVQFGSRRAGDTYEMQTPERRPLPFADCLPLLAEATPSQMKHIWDEDVDESCLKLCGE